MATAQYCAHCNISVAPHEPQTRVGGKLYHETCAQVMNTIGSRINELLGSVASRVTPLRVQPHGFTTH